MSMWITPPLVVVPKPDLLQPIARQDPLYQRYERIFLRLFQAFGRKTTAVDDGLLLPSAGNLDGEELAIKAIQPLMAQFGADWTPNLLVDCRSSAAIGGPAPTYKLAARVGLTKILPFAIDGQGGAEVAYALLLLQNMDYEIGRGAILSALQRTVPPDSRGRHDAFPLADAAAAIVVTRDPLSSNNALRVLAVAVGQRAVDWRSTTQDVLQEVLERAGVTRQMVRWSIGHRYSRSLCDVVSGLLPNARWLVRDLYPEYDFGCVDPLVSLGCLLGMPSAPLDGIGTIWCVGRFGTVGAILIRC